MLVLKSGVWLMDRTRTVYCVFYFKHFMPLYLYSSCLQNVWCWRSEVREKEMDSLFRGRDCHHFHRGYEWIRLNAGGGPGNGETNRGPMQEGSTCFHTSSPKNYFKNLNEPPPPFSNIIIFFKVFSWEADTGVYLTKSITLQRSHCFFIKSI